jgi:hypothetical protein
VQPFPVGVRCAFVARVGKPPATYLVHVRLDAATDLLRDTSIFMAEQSMTVNAGIPSEDRSTARRNPGRYQPITLFALSAWGWRRRE